MSTLPGSSLFPTPGVPFHPMLPKRLPGATPASSKTLKKVLEDNHRLHHIMFNDRGFHNHIPHHAIVLWAFGAPPEYIQRTYDIEAHAQRPIDYGVTPEVEPVTELNFFEHLGKARYYQGYLRYFSTVVASMGCARAVEKYVLSPEYNSRQGQMLNRYHCGVLHPLIHIGHGLEFGMTGLIIEGLALVAVQPADPAGDFFISFNPETSSHHSHPLLLQPPIPVILESLRTTPHALHFMARIDQDPAYHVPTLLFLRSPFFAKYGPQARAWAQEWMGPADSYYNLGDDELREYLWKKVEEIAWMNVVMYVAGGASKSDKEPEFQSDFYAMHLITSSIFLSAHLATLSPQSCTILFQAYFANSLLWYIARRSQVSLDISGFYNRTNELLQPPLPSLSLDNCPVNPWTEIIETSIQHEDEHYPKIHRALMHYDTLYGTKTLDEIFADSLPFPHSSPSSCSDRDLPQGSVFAALDGTVFLRASLVTMERINSVEKVRNMGPTAEGGARIWDGTGAERKVEKTMSGTRSRY